jgi:hypothetical protein
MLRWLALLAAADVLLAGIIGVRSAWDGTTRLSVLIGAAALVFTGIVFQRAARVALTADAAPRRAETLRMGILLGALWLVEIGINNLAMPPVPLRDRVDNLFWAAIAVLMCGYAAREAMRAGRVQAGMASGIWTGLVSGLIACTAALMLATVGGALLARDPLNIAEWTARHATTTAPSFNAYFAMETTAGAILHLTVLGLVMGALLGAAGGVIGVGLRRLRPN